MQLTHAPQRLFALLAAAILALPISAAPAGAAPAPVRLDDEVTQRDNQADFARIRLRPRMLVDVTQCDTSTSVLGQPVPMPILIAPTSMHCLAHPEGECATAQAAGAARTLMIASTDATRPLEEIAQAASSPLWFQLYIYGSLEIAGGLVRRAEAAGYQALVLTVDLPVMGNRERSKRHAVPMPACHRRLPSRRRRAPRAGGPRASCSSSS